MRTKVPRQVPAYPTGVQVSESKTKRIFADVSMETRNQFLAKARLDGTTGQALIETWVS